MLLNGICFFLWSYLIDLFDNYMQQDAHEFLNYLLNTVADILQEEKKQEKQNGRLKNNGIITPDTECENKNESTWVHDIFQGTLTNETRCLNCETVSFFYVGLNLFMHHCHTLLSSKLQFIKEVRFIYKHGGYIM